MRNYAAILTIFFLSSCCKATQENITVFKNTTSDKIELRFYKAGEFKSSIIEANSTTTAFFDIPYTFADSAHVLINNIHRQSHYDLGINKSSNSIEVYLFDEPGNLLKMNNYEITRKELTSSYCGGSVVTYSYSF